MAESHRDEIAKLESMFKANPEGRVFTHLAEAYRKAGELDRAHEVLEEGLRRHSDSASGFVVLGRVMQDLGQPQDAASAFARVLELDPENRVALRALGDLARTAGRQDEALAQYEQLLTLDPSDEELEVLVSELKRGGAQEPGPAHEAELPAPESVEAAPGLELTSMAPSETSFAALDVGELTSFSGEPHAEQDRDISLSLESTSEAPAPPEPEPVSGEAAPELPASEPMWSAGAPEEAASWPGAGAEQEPAPAELPEMSGFMTEGEAAPPAWGAPPDEPAAPPAWGSPADEAAAPPAWGSPSDEAAAPPAWAAPSDEAAPDVVGGELVTETMAELYRSQGHMERAAEVYRALLQERPGDEQLERKLLELELAILSPEASATPPQAVTEPTEPADLEQPAAWAPPTEAVLDDAALEAPAAELDATAPEVGGPTFDALETELSTGAPAGGELAGAGETLPSIDSFGGELAEPEQGGDATPSAAQEPWSAGEQPEAPAYAAEAAAAPVESGWEHNAETGSDEVAEPVPMPTMEAVLSGGGDLAQSEPNPYAWEAGAAEEVSGPPVSAYLRTLVSWRSSAPPASEPMDSTPGELVMETPPEVVAPETEYIGDLPEAYGQEAPATEAPAGFEPAEFEAPAFEPPPSRWDTTPESQAPTWADEAAAAPWDEAPPAQPEPAAGEDMDWLLGPDGVAPETPPPAAPAADSAAEGQDGPGDDDDLEMFRAWLQSLKK